MGPGSDETSNARARLAAAEAALREGRGADAIDHLLAAMALDPAQPVGPYRDLVRQLHLQNRPAEAEAWSSRAVAQHPTEAELWSLRGVMLRQRRRLPEALEALDRAVALDPGFAPAQANRGNLLLDLGRAAEAEAVFADLLMREPANPAFLSLQGQALAVLDRPTEALARLRAAVEAAPSRVETWLQLAGVLGGLHRPDEAEAALDQALQSCPADARLLEAKALVMREAGRPRRAIAFLQDLASAHDAEGWLHFQLGNLLGDYDRPAGNWHLRRAVALEPENLDYLTGLAQSLERTEGLGSDEGSNLDEAVDLAREALAIGGLSVRHSKVAVDVFSRVCAFDEMAAVGDLRTIGRGWAAAGQQASLFRQLARVTTHEDKLELLEQHRIWGRKAEASASAHPIAKPPRRAPGGKIRVGFMSSDLRKHPVSYYALPLFDEVDPSCFELYAYSYALTSEDDLQRHIASRVEAFRWMPNATARDAAQTIADDQLDMLVELGGATHMNRPEVLAYGPAPRQASWLGYPHSVGLSNVDYLICDRYCAPASPDLALEQPLLIDTWLTLSQAIFSEAHPIAPRLPEERNGALTFGTANQPHKYSREVLRAWARITAAVPQARFAFIRSEVGSESFRRHVLAEFAREGVAADRVLFYPVRDGHMRLYNEVDISLDTFPRTGGATTTESLWMGVPVISLVGDALFERLSYSILSHAGLGDLCAFDLDAYVAKALELAADRKRRAALRRSLRAGLREGPLGDTRAFALNFYDVIARTVATTPPRR